MKLTRAKHHSRPISKVRPLTAQDSNPSVIFILDVLIAILDLVIRQKR